MEPPPEVHTSRVEYLRFLIGRGISAIYAPTTSNVSRQELSRTSEQVRHDTIKAAEKKLEQFTTNQDEGRALLEKINQEMANQPNESKSVQIGEESDEEMNIDEEQPAALIAQRKSPLSSEELQAITRILQQSSSSRALVIDKFNIDITEGKIAGLKPRTWLNDEIVNFYMCMLQERDQKLCERSNGSRKPSYYFNSFFVSKLTENGVYTYSNVKRWSKKIDVFAMDRIFMPVNISNSHWVMAVVFVTLKEIRYYDSMSGSAPNTLNAILRWLTDEAREKKGVVLDTSEWKLIDTHKTHVPQQGNGYDCGVFSIMCADYLSDNLPLEYSQNEMPDNRLKIGAAIKRGFLLY